MKQVELLPHNEKAYGALKKCLETNQMASINHATGTGKSFILLKYLYENRNKRILYLSPTYPIIDQLMDDHMEELGISKEEFAKIDGMIYRTLLGKDMKELASKYDIIILDEYHRCGAKLWGKKVHELLEEIKDNYPDTKVVGTTATEIRYLDQERNMNNILFNGVEASRLTLADAILEEILPAPLYVSFNISLLEDLQKIEDDISKYAFYSEDKEIYLKEIQNYRRELEASFYNNKNIKEYLSQCRKYLVFSSSIYNIRKDKLFMHKLIPNIDNNLVVHSRQTKEKNKKNLKEFRTLSKDQISVLYSIDILNEGVHVKGADAAVLRRRTVSPIIYFQQLGRLLSYSRRKDCVVILDMVNNIKRHPVIYELYQDVVKRAKELLVSHPENKERYRRIIDRFRIVNETGILSERLDKLKVYYSKESILERRLYRAVSILEDEHYPNEIEKYQAQIDIIKYEDYITLPLFERIKRLQDIKKPPIARLTKEEFVEYLNGSKNIKGKHDRHLKELYKEMIKFFDMNYYLPSIFSSDKEEKELAIKILSNLYYLSNKALNFIRDNLSDNLSLFERISYGEEIDNVDIDILIEETKKASKLSVPITHSVYFKLVGKMDARELEKILIKNHSKSEIEGFLDEAKAEEERRKRKENDYSFHTQFEEVAKKMLDEIEKVGIDKYVDDLFKDIIDFMKAHNKSLEYYNSSKYTYTDKDRQYEQELYCKKIILQGKLIEKGYLKIIEDLELSIRTHRQYVIFEELINKIVKFIDEHTGSLPSIKNTRLKGEKDLAMAYGKNYALIPEELKQKVFDAQAKYPNKKREVLSAYVDFIRKNRRKPMFDPQYIEEYVLNEELNRWMVFLSEYEKKELDRALNSVNKYESIRNTYNVLKKTR